MSSRVPPNPWREGLTFSSQVADNSELLCLLLTVFWRVNAPR